MTFIIKITKDCDVSLIKYQAQWSGRDENVDQAYSASCKWSQATFINLFTQQSIVDAQSKIDREKQLLPSLLLLLYYCFISIKDDLGIRLGLLLWESPQELGQYYDTSRHTSLFDIHIFRNYFNMHKLGLVQLQRYPNHFLWGGTISGPGRGTFYYIKPRP